MVWDRLNQSASTVVQTFSSCVQHAMMDDILWLVSYQSVGHTVMFSTVSRDALARCIGPGMIDLAMQKSRPDSRVVLIVPSRDEAGEIVYKLTATFLRIP